MATDERTGVAGTAEEPRASDVELPISELLMHKGCHMMDAAESKLKDADVAVVTRLVDASQQTEHEPLEELRAELLAMRRQFTELSERLATRDLARGADAELLLQAAARDKEEMCALAKRVMSSDEKGALVRLLEAQLESVKLLRDSVHRQQAAAEAAADKVMAVVAAHVSQSRQDHDGLASAIPLQLRHHQQAMVEQVQQLQSDIQQQQQQQHHLESAGLMRSESFRAHVNCYDVAIAVDDVLLLATNKGIFACTPQGTLVSHFLCNDHIVAIDTFNFDSFVAAVLWTAGHAKTKPSDKKDAAAGEGSTVAIITPGSWTESGRFQASVKVHCLCTVPSSGDVLVSSGLGHSDIFRHSRSGACTNKISVQCGVKAISASRAAIVVSSCEAADGCYAVEAYSFSGHRLWQHLSAEPVHDLCCDPWGGVYMALRDGGRVSVVDGRDGREFLRTASSIAEGLTKPAFLAMDGLGHRMVVLSYDARSVNALRCKTRSIKLSSFI